MPTSGVESKGSAEGAQAVRGSPTLSTLCPPRVSPVPGILATEGAPGALWTRDGSVPSPRTSTGQGRTHRNRRLGEGRSTTSASRKGMPSGCSEGGAHTSKCRKYDCSLYPDQCSADATCEEVEYLPGKSSNICVCKKGFTGNGIQCIEISSSSILPPAKESSTTEIDLKLTTELFLGPQGDNVTDLSKDNFDKIQEFLDSGKPEDTADGSTCQVVASSNPTPESRLINSNQYRSLMVEASHGRF